MKLDILTIYVTNISLVSLAAQTVKYDCLDQQTSEAAQSRTFSPTQLKPLKKNQQVFLMDRKLQKLQHWL